MSSFHSLTYHVTFSTKYRRKALRKECREKIYQYLGGVLRNLNGHVIEIGGVEDHVHLLACIPPTRAVSDAIRTLKANTSKWINEQGVLGAGFEWQKGYGAFTVSYSQIEIVRRYIRTQEEHHRTLTFEQEFIGLLKKHQITFDSKYVFEQEHHG